MEAALRVGVSLRRWDGWEPRRVTVHTYDQQGRPDRSVTYTEPEWDDEQRGWVLALLEAEAGECSGCGGNLDDTMHPDAEEAWVGEIAGRCHRCTALAVAADRWTGNKDVKHPQALRFRATRHR